MSHPTCPNCGNHEFRLVVCQTVDVLFYDTEDGDDDDHAITDGPDGDIEWDDDTIAICTECGHTAPLKEMTA